MTAIWTYFTRARPQTVPKFQEELNYCIDPQHKPNILNDVSQLGEKRAYGQR